MDQISGLSQKCPDFSKIMSGILDPRIPTFWNSEEKRNTQSVIFVTPRQSCFSVKGKLEIIEQLYTFISIIPLQRVTMEGIIFIFLI